MQAAPEVESELGKRAPEPESTAAAAAPGDGAASGADAGNAKKKKKPTEKRSQVLTEIIEFIREQKKAAGSSSIKIVAQLKVKFHEKIIKKTLKSGVETGELVQNRQSYLVAGDPLYEELVDRVTISEIMIGEGEKVVMRGDTIAINYIGVLAENRAEFDRGTNFIFEVGAGDVVKGMDQGVIGMKVGGQRTIIIPSSLGYGKRGSGPEIPPNSTISFDVTLKVNHGVVHQEDS